MQEVCIKNELIDSEKIERDGNPDNMFYRIKNTHNTVSQGIMLHDVIEEYLAEFLPVSPKVDGRAFATDAPATLLAQVKGVNYQFR